MTTTKIDHIVRSTISLTTEAPTRAEVLPYGASGVELRGVGLPTWQFTPRLIAAWWDDNSTCKDQTANLNERGEGSFWEADSFAQTNDALYVGCDVPFRGVYINVINANATSSVATWSYRKANNTWADTSDTDNTISTGATLGHDDTVTWAVPSDWIKYIVPDTFGAALYWVRLTVGATLDSDVRIGSIVPLGVQSNQPVAITSVITALPRYWFNPEAVGGIEATGADTNTLVLDWLVTGKNTGIIAE